MNTRTALLGLGIVGVGIPIYVLAGEQAFTATQGQVSLPGATALTTWETWAGVIGIVLILLAIFL